jgi:hypothetical protein
MIRRFAACCAVLALLASPALAQQAVDASGPDRSQARRSRGQSGRGADRQRPSAGTGLVEGQRRRHHGLCAGRAGLVAPDKLDFDDSVLRRRLDGANVLIMGQEADRQRILSLLGLIPGRGKEFISGQADARHPAARPARPAGEAVEGS